MKYTALAGSRLGRYEMRQLLGSEAGIVATYKAYQPALKRQVAVQVMNPLEESWKEAFRRAAEIMAGLEHTNIVPVHDYDVVHGFPFIVTRLMEGGSLRRRLESGPVSLQTCVAVVRQVSSALEYGHARGMAHGDPSVANIVFDEWGSAYVADFHVAGFANVGHAIAGTPLYMAPEKWATGTGTPHTDQYALACIAYQMLIGTPPFVGEINAVMAGHAIRAPKPVHVANATMPQTVSDVLARAMAKSPDSRYPTISEFAISLERAAASHPRHVFLSYARSDAEYVEKLKTALVESGFEVWIDFGIDLGEQWFTQIDGAIKACAAFVLIMSPRSQVSEWTHKEILLARRYQKPVLPLLLEGDALPIVIDLQSADVRGGRLPDADFHRRLRRIVFGQV
jgi:serine/threonine protein kinase